MGIIILIIIINLWLQSLVRGKERREVEGKKVGGVEVDRINFKHNWKILSYLQV